MGDEQLQNSSTGTQVRHTPTINIAIPFQPLLAEIVQCFYFHEPEYKILDASKNSVCVNTESKRDATEMTYIGGTANSIEDFHELAAQRVVHAMIQKFKIIVEDFTYHHELETERCCHLYKLKRIELEQISQRTTLNELEETVPISPPGYIQIYLDYMSILRKIFTTITIKCTKLQNVEHYPRQPSKLQEVIPKTGNLGPRSSTIKLAKNYLAKKAINYLIPAYNIQMVDANFGSINSKSTKIMLELERGSYLTTRALLFGIDEEPAFSSIIKEEDGLSIEGIVSYTPPAHLQLDKTKATTPQQQPFVSVARRVLSFEDAF